MKRLVISAVNFTEGGPLSILRQVARAASEHFPDWEVYALVHETGLLQCLGITELTFPRSKGSWLVRLRLEWWQFHRLSLDLRPDVWLSLHDITPRVRAGRQYVYCHNPAPFADRHYAAEKLDRGFGIFRRYYGQLYRCFIHRNRAVIVQQEWLRRVFETKFGVARVIVAHPDLDRPVARPHASVKRLSTYIFPAFPRIFKNYELLGECAAILEREPTWQGRILLTIDGSENAYAHDIRRRYGSLRSLEFIGLQTPARLQAIYATCDALVFPSLLETWGLPISEAKAHGLAVLAADLPYARETVGTYDAVRFFDPQDAQALANLMLSHHTTAKPLGGAVGETVPEPFAESWKRLLEILLIDDEPAPAAESSLSRSVCRRVAR